MTRYDLSRSFATRLAAHEARTVTHFGHDWPIFWDRASGATVFDVDGNEYIDCTAAFGVANVGHSNSHVTDAIAQQARRLMHGMGDVHPTALRVQLFERLASILPKELDKCFLATSGAEAIEIALKTAMLATGKARFAAYRGGYHGLSFGALAVGGISHFRAPFTRALPPEPLLLDYPRNGATTVQAAIGAARTALKEGDDIAALVIEPIQGRAGCIVPPPGFLTALRALCDELHIVMIVDEIFTGFGRTGHWFAIDDERVVPDILCIGKAMTSGFPMSVTVGSAAVMDAWPLSSGEALHTSTHLGNPLGCAAALATIDEMERLDLPSRAATLGAAFDSRLRTLLAHDCVVEVRRAGLFWGVQLDSEEKTGAVVRRALQQGVIFLQSGVCGDVIAISPPLTIGNEKFERAIAVLEQAILEVD